MKLIVLVALVAVAAAQKYVKGSDENAETVRNDFKLNDDGSYNADMATSNGIQVQSDGESFPGAEPETGNYVMSGSYSYTAPDGTPISVTWIADENGFQAESDSIPKVEDTGAVAVE